MQVTQGKSTSSGARSNPPTRSKQPQKQDSPLRTNPYGLPDELHNYEAKACAITSLDFVKRDIRSFENQIKSNNKKIHQKEGEINVIENSPP